MNRIAEVVGESKRFRSVSFERRTNDSELCFWLGESKRYESKAFSAARTPTIYDRWLEGIVELPQFSFKEYKQNLPKWWNW
ncbi:MAG: hypothetical protein GKR91_10040 [Pseudomonadales bacterium]|nr:hypothetical protein [Pseudomonadales bacterium]